MEVGLQKIPILFIAARKEGAATRDLLGRDTRREPQPGWVRGNPETFFGEEESRPLGQPHGT